MTSNSSIVPENQAASNSISLTPPEFEPENNLENPSSFEVFQQLLKDDYHQFIKKVEVDSMAFLASLANIDDANTLLKIDVNDKTIPAKYRLVVHWSEEANKLQEQTNTLNPLPDDVPEPFNNASPDTKEKYQRHKDYVKKVRNQRKQAPVVQKAFDNVCSRMIRFDVSKSRFTFDDDTVVVWTDIKKLMKEVLAVRKKPFYDGLIHNNLRNIDYDHIIDRLSLDNIYYPQQHWAQSLPVWDGNDRYRLLADTFHLDLESSEFKIVLTWFKGTMNRWLVPGSKNDNVLVIHGAQGKGKSTFFRKLTPSHATGFGTSDKDDLLKYHKYMLVEFEELDGLTKKADVTAIKIFFSLQEDDIRPPYGRESILFRRAFSCCATVNTGNFLKDSTGNRRFITISIGNNAIDSSWLDDENERNQFWAQVKEDAELLSYVPPGLESVQEKMSASFVHEDSDTELIVDYISSLSEEAKTNGRIPNPFNTTNSQNKYNPNTVPMTKGNLAFAIFGIEAYTSHSISGNSETGARISGRLEKTLAGKLHNVMVNKLRFNYKLKRFKDEGPQKVYYRQRDL